jgi:hypothetical protein
MKGDFSRSSFDFKKHYRSVLMQQGRVQMDADWNEQLSIHQHVEQTSMRDAVGPDGTPFDRGGFRIDAKPDGSDLLISAGRIYVDGILCENEAPIAYSDQFTADYPDNTSVAKILSNAGATVGIVYLDVWDRHITALEDPQIREVALGGPDTATRAQTVWQVKLVGLPGSSVTVTPALTALLASRQTISAALESAEKAGDAAAIAQHRNELAANNGAIGQLIAASGLQCLMSTAPWNNIVTPADGHLTARVHPGQAATNPCELLPLGGYQRLENQLYRVEIHDGGAIGKATFKWSRENGSVVTSWLGQDVLNLKVASTGRDAPLGFASGDWVELTDDVHDLLAQPGMMVQIDKAEGDIITVKPPASGTIKFTDYPRNPKIRRWDQPDATEVVQVPATNSGYIPLEGGVEIQFSGTNFRSGDYWEIPARTAIADTEIGGILWPQDGSGNPLAEPPMGIRHHYSRLALVFLDAGKLNVLTDCRNLFPPLTQLTELFYLGGDGQEGLPGATLPVQLRAGVSTGEFPVPGATVRYQVVAGTGTLNTGLNTVDVVTDQSGVAACTWTLDAATPTQAIEARLLAPDGSFLHLPIRYNASLRERSVFWISNLAMSNDLPLRNDSQMIAEDMINGIHITCNAPVMGASLSRSSSCFVTLLIPYPIGGDNFWDVVAGSLGYEPVIVSGRVALDTAKPSVMVWRPQPDAQKWLSFFFTRIENFNINITAVPAILTIKGNFILPAAEPLQPLDADGFIDPKTGFLHLPTGDGRSGGDLELYFWFVKQRSAYLTFDGIGSELI